jgi:nucleotide-binding universal stress UspA family protein
VSFKSIAVFLDARPSSSIRFEIAVSIARKHGASLVAIWVEMPPKEDDGRTIDFARGRAMADVVERYALGERLAREQVVDRLDRLRHADGLSSEIRELPLQADARDAVLHARYSDLVVVGAVATKEAISHPYGWSIEDVIKSAAVPLLVVPSEPIREFACRRILIAWNASVGSRHAVADAMPFLQAADFVWIVTVDPRTGRHEHGAEPGADIARYLLKHEVEVQIERASASEGSVAEAILSECERVEADLVVAGAYGHSRASTLFFGSTTRELVHRARTALLVSR